MPASLAPTTIDLIANLEQIGPLLQNLLDGSYVGVLPDAETAEAEDTREESLQSVLAQVHARNGIDFSSYKRPTILRRLQRRMIATNVSDLREYSRYLANHLEEYQRLTASFLIKVTEFFRSPELFRVLREQVIPEIIAQARTHNNVLRIWSAGCATGEEAYSLAILVAETLGEEIEQFQVQIFATDLDNDAVAFARRGIYPHAALTGLPEELISRYFVKLDGVYEVTKQLRGLVIFGQHDLGQRAPFPHIDLVLCRNVLIYFTKELQARALQLFAFAPRDGGYLALGKAETVHPLDAYFTSADGHLKLYRRRGERVLCPIARIDDLREITQRLPMPEQWLQQRPPIYQNMQDTEHIHLASTHPTPSAQRARTSGEWLGNIVLDLPLGVVVVDRRYDIQAINSAAPRLLGITPQRKERI